MISDNILFYSKGRIATLTINREEKANAFNIDMLKKMYSYLTEIDKNEKIRCIIIKSAGNQFFSSGYDLEEIKNNNESAKKYMEWGRKVNQYLLLMKKPIIVQVQGIAIGFGAMLILASDLRIFANRPKQELYLKFPELKMSIFPQTGGTLLPLLVFGINITKNLLYTCKGIGIDELKTLNIPTRIYPIEEIDSETIIFAKEITRYKKEFTFLLKPMLNIMNKKQIISCLDLEDECSKIAYSEKKTMKELDKIIEELYHKL